MKTWVRVVVLACATSCDGKSMIAGVELPSSVVPNTVDFPAVFPTKIGGTTVDSDLYDLEKKQPGVRLVYRGGESPNHRTVTGYVVLFTSDPVPDLTKRWGSPTAGPTSGPGISTDTESVIKLRPKTRWDLTFSPMT